MLVVSATMVQRTCVVLIIASNKVLSENLKAFFTHCFGYALILAVGDMVKTCTVFERQYGHYIRNFQSY